MRAYYSILAISLFVLFIGFGSSMPEPRNPPTGFTGAPGELTCQNKDCHGGGNFTGSVELLGIPDTILANTSYEISVLLKSDTAVRTGFQLTVIDDDLKFTGTLSTIMGETVNVAKDNVTQRTYARQSAAKFFNAGEAKWRFNWTAPATLPTDSLSFYFVGLMANGDGEKTKDNVIANKKRFYFKVPVGTEDEQLKNADVQFIQTSNFITITGTDAGQISSLRLLSLNGTTSHLMISNDLNIIPISHLKSGLYIVQYQFREKLFSKKIIIN